MLPRIKVFHEAAIEEPVDSVAAPSLLRRTVLTGVAATVGLGLTVGPAAAAGHRKAHKAAAHKAATHAHGAHRAGGSHHGAAHRAGTHRHKAAHTLQHHGALRHSSGHGAGAHVDNTRHMPQVIRPAPGNFSHFVRMPESTTEGERKLTLYVPNTGESIASVYWADGEYIPAGLREISYLLRDHRTDTAVGIAPGLLDYLHRVRGTLEYQRPIEVISGYRSPRTNEMLRQHQDGVAKNSYHTKGRAVDIVMPGVDLRIIRNAALSLNGGGVGYYPDSRFVHLDCGPRRTWIG